MTDSETFPSPSPATPPELAATPVKPGWQTTEFYLSLAATLLTALFASGLLTSNTALAIAGMAATVLTALGYKVSRTLVKTAAVLALVVLGLGAAQLSCTPTQRTTAGHAVVDCTAASAGAISATLAAMRAPAPDGCASGAGTDWGCVRGKAISAGLQVGGCAFLELVSGPAARVASATGEPPPERPGVAAFESYRASIAGGAAFRTAAGDR